MGRFIQKCLNVYCYRSTHLSNNSVVIVLVIGYNLICNRVSSSRTRTQIHIHTYIHTLDVSVVKWLSCLACNCSRISAIGSGPSNGLKPNLGGQKGFIYLCQCVYIYQHNTLVFGLPVKSTANVQIQLELWSTGWNDK